MLLTRIFSFLFSIILIGAPASAETCTDKSDIIEHADVIFEGIALTNFDSLGTKALERRAFAIHGEKSKHWDFPRYRTQFLVKEGFKGGQKGIVDVWMPKMWVQPIYTVGDTFMVYAFFGRDGKLLMPNNCWYGHAPNLEELREYYEGWDWD